MIKNRLFEFILKSCRLMQILSARVASWSFLHFNCEDDILKKTVDTIIESAKVMMAFIDKSLKQYVPKSQIILLNNFHTCFVWVIQLL